MKNIQMRNISVNSHEKQQPFFFKQVRSLHARISSPPHTRFSLLEIAAFVFSVSLILPVIMTGVGKS